MQGDLGRLILVIRPELRESVNASDKAGSAGINRHVVGDARALQERRERIHPDPESCGDRCEAIVEA